MKCVCGKGLGPITTSTKGLCKACGRSLWIQAALARLEFTTAQAVHVAKRLNDSGATTCAHGKRPCISHCGVEADHSLFWRPIPLERRRAWFENLLQRKGNSQ
jgi:hypothetical protein